MSFKPGKTFKQLSTAVLNYEMNWTNWLDGAEIGDSSWAVTGDDNLLEATFSAIMSGNKKTRVTISGGTVGVRYKVSNHIVTSEDVPQEDERFFYVQVVDEL